MRILYYLQHTGVPVNIRVFIAFFGFGDTYKNGNKEKYVNGIRVYPKPYTVAADGGDGSIPVNVWDILRRSQTRPATTLWTRSSMRGPATVDEIVPSLIWNSAVACCTDMRRLLTSCIFLILILERRILKSRSKRGHDRAVGKIFKQHAVGHIKETEGVH